MSSVLGGRDVNLNYLGQIAQAADDLGYFGVLLPAGCSCKDSWVVTSSLAPLTRQLRYLVASAGAPLFFRRGTATLDRIS